MEGPQVISLSKKKILQKKQNVNDGLWRVIKITLVLKAAILGTICLGVLFFPFHAANYAANFSYPAGEAPGFFSHFKTWDAQHYLFLSEEGYQPGQISNAFFPFFPFLIHAASYLFFKNTLAAGLFLSNLLSLVAMVYLYLLVEKKSGKKTAIFTCVFLAAFPTAFYLDLVYTESLFLMLAVAFFYYKEENKPVYASLCAFLLPLTRPTGILMIAVALAVVLFPGKPKGRNDSGKTWVFPLLFIAGFVFYLALMNFFTNDIGAAFSALRVFLGHHTLANLFHPLNWIVSNFVTNPYTLCGFGTGILDRLSFIFFLVMVFLAFRRLDVGLLSYVLVLGLIPALGCENLASFARYCVVLFPLFIVLASHLQKKPGYYLTYLSVCLPLQAVLVLAHSLNYWIS
jgi:hypothetical protein